MRPLGWTLAASLGLLSLLLIAYLEARPLVLDGSPEQAEARGYPPDPFERGDVALVLDRAAVARAAQLRSFAAADFSCAWMNILEAELGAYSLVEAGEFDPGEYRAVVVSRSAHRSVDAGALARFAREGGVCMIDGPLEGASWPEALAQLTSTRAGPAEELPADRLLPARALGDDQSAFAASVPTVPSASIAPSEAVPRGIFLTRRLGNGRVIACRVNVARWYTTLVQGRPATDDFALDDGDGRGMPENLLAGAVERDDQTPFADLLARAVVAELDPPDQPLPRLLWFPAQSKGVFLVTLDEEFLGGAACARIAERIAALGGRITVFAIGHRRVLDDWLTGDDLRPFHERGPDSRDDHATAIGRQGGAIGVLWNRDPMPYPIGPLDPVAFEFGLESQIARLRGISRESARCAVGRVRGQVLGPAWTSVFRILAAQGVLLDSTYGLEDGAGYPFGTARPYAILDENGFPIPVRGPGPRGTRPPIRELPIAGHGGGAAAFLERMLRDNAERHHGAIVMRFQAALGDDDERALERVLRVAAETGHRPMNAHDLIDFWSARTQASVRSRVDGDQLVIDVQGGLGELGISLPVLAGESRIARLDDDTEIPLERIRVGALEHDVFRVPAGQLRVRVRTQTP